jgi:ribosomal protein S10
LIAKALGHSNGNNVAGIYLEMFDQDRLDEMHNEICKNATKAVNF